MAFLAVRGRWTSASTSGTETARSLILQNEPWKDNAKGDVRRHTSAKYDRLFDERQKRYIQERLVDLDALGL